MSLNLPNNSESAQQQEILDALPVLIFLERAGRIVYANSEARHLLEMGEEEWIPRPVEEVLWGLFPGTAEPRTLLTGTRWSSPFHATLATRTGRLHPVEGTYSVVDPDLREAIVVAQPGAREKAPRPRLMEDVLSCMPEAVAIVHHNHVLYTNAAFTRMFGYSSEESTGESLRDLILPETRRHEIGQLERAVDRHGFASMETVRMGKSGELVDVSLLAKPLVVNGEKAGYVLSYRDIGERKQIEAKLQDDALHDTLTGLPNRALFMDRLSLALVRRLRRRDQNCGLLFLDLDGFGEINETLGTAAGDELLIAVANRLRAALRPQDSSSRLEGDAFAILVEGVLSVDDLEVVAGRILQEMERPFDVYGQAVHASVSIGAVLAGAEHSTPELLFRDADLARGRARQQGGGMLEVFDRHLQRQGTGEMEREQELRQALEKREFEIWYQPIYRLQTGKLEGFESLLRWRRANGVVDGLGDLQAVAEDTGLSISLGRATMDAVCAQLHDWAGALPESGLMLSINVTRRQFYHPDTLALLKRALETTGADSSRLMLEVAESTLNENPDAAVAILQRMVDCNLRVAVDNFGSGLAPLNYLVRLPIEVVKLAPQFTRSATTTGREAAALEALIQLGRNLGLQVVAQGIETQEQLNALCRLGCELGQGHLLSHALEPTLARRLAAQGGGTLRQGA